MFFIVISIFCVIGLLRYYFIFSQIKISSFDIKNKSYDPAVSVIICAKNELKNIQSFFASWMQQKYPEFELIIVNDQSTDGTYDYLTSLEKKHEKLKVIHISLDLEKNLKGKRHALQKGIENAKNEYILLTDADCQPLSHFWIASMMEGFKNSETEIVLGHSPYRYQNGVLNKLIQYETLLTMIQYIGFANINRAYMGVGRNIAYKKSLLGRDIFEKSNLSISGDDDLIMQQLSTNSNTAYIIDKESTVESLAPISIKEWISQKTRHLGAGICYHNKIKTSLGIFIVLNILFYAIFYTKFFSNPFLFAILLLVKGSLFYASIRHIQKFNNALRINFLDILILDLFYWIFYLTFVFIVFIS